MSTRMIVAVTVCALALLTAGCSGKGHFSHYYVLEVPPAPQATESLPRLPATVAVQRFDAPPYLRQGRIVYREAAAEIGFYNYHRWAEDPTTTVTSTVIDSLRSSHLFAAVKPYDGQSHEDYLMSGRLERLEEIDSAAGVGVAAKVSAQLVDLRTGVTVWTGGGQESLNVETRTVNSVVVEMSHAVNKSVDRMLAGLAARMVPGSGGV